MKRPITINGVSIEPSFVGESLVINTAGYRNIILKDCEAKCLLTALTMYYSTKEEQKAAASFKFCDCCDIFSNDRPDYEEECKRLERRIKSDDNCLHPRPADCPLK